MADRNYYRSVTGVTHGTTHYPAGAVFPGDEVLDNSFQTTDGKDAEGTTRYEKASLSDYQKYVADSQVDLVSGAPARVVGFEPVGEDSLLDTQLEDSDTDERKPLTADAQAGKPEKGDSIPLDAAEAERRAATEPESLDGQKGGPSVPDNPVTSQGTKRRS